MAFPSKDEKRELRECVDEWFNSADDGTNTELSRVDSYVEDEDCLLEMFHIFFKPELKDPEFGLFLFRAAYTYLYDQREVARAIFEHPSSTRGNGLLDKMDGVPGTFETRSEAKAFFEAALMPYAKDDAEREHFWTFFAEEMTFDDDESAAEPQQKRTRVQVEVME